MPGTPQHKAPFWLVYVGFATLVLGVALQVGINLQRIADVSDRVSKLEARDAKIDEISNRLSRIQGTLDALRQDRDSK